MKIPPPFKDLLPTEAIKQLSQLVSQPALFNAMKEAAQKLGWKEGTQLSNVQSILQQAGRWMEHLAEPWASGSNSIGLRPGINATGEIFTARWTNARSGESASRLAALLENSFTEPSRLDSQLRHLLMGLTSAQEVLVVPNTSIALWLVARSSNNGATEGKKSEWILPRADCLRLPLNGNGNGANVRDILDQTGVTIHEIGTTNDCTEADFRSVLHSRGQSLLLASTPPTSTGHEHHPVGIKVVREVGGSVCRILVDGSIHATDTIGLDTSIISDRVVEDDIVIVPGEYLVGGPECTIILGKLAAIQPVIQLAHTLGWGSDNITKAKLLACLQDSQTLEQWTDSPIGRVLTTSLENLDNRARRIATQVHDTALVERAVVDKRLVRIGAALWSRTKIESATVQVYPRGKSASALAEELAADDLPIWVNIQSEYLELVLRTVEPDEDRLIVKRLATKL